MKNVTITLDEKVASWARVRAAEMETSVSKLVGKMLEERMREEEGYRAAMQRYFSKGNVNIKKPGTAYPPREKLHER